MLLAKNDCKSQYFVRNFLKTEPKINVFSIQESYEYFLMWIQIENRVDNNVKIQLLT